MALIPGCAPCSTGPDFQEDPDVLHAINLLWSVLNLTQDANNHTGKDQYVEMRLRIGKVRACWW